MRVNIAAAKINKYSSSESGDTLEVVERPSGGISVVLADGQTSGIGAKSISNQVVRKVISLLAEGVRDGAAARAASDYLFTSRRGKVSATLNILSIDLITNTLVITRNNEAPTLLARNNQITVYDSACTPIGLYRDTRPVIIEIPIVSGLTAVVFSDGILHAGSRQGKSLNSVDWFHKLIGETREAQDISESFLSQALKLDDNRPTDDISIVSLQISGNNDDNIRRISVNFPISI